MVDVNNPNFEHISGVLFDKIDKSLRTYPAGNNAAIYAIPEGILSIGEDAFFGCESLTSITIPKSVTSIGSGAFFECTSLSSITIPKSVTSIGKDIFLYCDCLAEIKVKEHSYAHEFFMKTKYAPLLSTTLPGSDV
jgi:hypothetical protein